MLTNEENIIFQAEKHPLKLQKPFESLIQYLEYLMHSKAYEVSANMATGRTVLDYGCNVGYGTNILSNYCKKAVGIDVSLKAIETARKSYEGERIEFHSFDGLRASFEDNCFEMIVSLQVIEHVVDIRPYLLEIQRLIAPTGIAVFTTPNATIRLEPGMKPWNKYHVREYTATELHRTLARYFSHVMVKGLYAKDPIHQIIFNRFQKAKMKARRRSRLSYRARKAFSRRLGNIIPDSVQQSFDRLFGQKVSQRRTSAKNRLNDRIMKRYSTADFYYSEKNPEQGLDLIAFCSDVK